LNHAFSTQRVKGSKEGKDSFLDALFDPLTLWVEKAQGNPLRSFYVLPMAEHLLEL